MDDRAKRIEQLGPGPWVDEPDRVEWSYLGFPCLLHRNLFWAEDGHADGTGSWCGYVGVPPGHPWYGKSDGDLDCAAAVHGGITYAAACSGHICHVPAPGEPDDVFWVGFDANHASDYAPRTRHMLKERPGMPEFLKLPELPGHLQGVYRDVVYMRDEVERLAQQAAEAAQPADEARAAETGQPSPHSTSTS